MKRLILSLFISCSILSNAQISIPQVTGLPTALNSKVDKVTGKSLVADTSIVKLNAIQAGAQVNKLEGIQKNGVDLTITGKKVNITVPTTAAEISAEPANANIQTHISSTSNPHSVTKVQVGLSNVDNTSDANKPISTAVQTALNGKQPSGTYSTDIHSNITALNAVSGTNTGDETLTSIKTKLGAASASNAGYLTSTDWTTFNGKQPAGSYLTGITSGQVTTALGYTPLPTRTFGTAANNNTVDFYASGSTVANSAKWNNLSYNLGNVTTPYGLLSTDGSNVGYSVSPDIKTWLGLGSNAYTSTSYLPLIGGSISGRITSSYSGNVFYAATNIVGPRFSGNWSGSYSWGIGAHDANGNNVRIGITDGTTNNETWYTGSVDLYLGPSRKVWHSDNLTQNLSTNYIPKWNGSSFVNSLISDDGANTVYQKGIRFSFSGGVNNILYAGGVGGVFQVNNQADNLALFSITNTGLITIPNTTSSTLPTNGALVVNGGVGVGGKLNIGNAEQSDMDGTTINGGSISTNGGISAVKDINAGGNINAYGDIKATGDVYTNSNIKLDPIWQLNSIVNGSVSGDMLCVMPIRTLYYKKVILHLNSFNGSATYTYPVSFTNQPVVLMTGGLSTSYVTSVGTTSVVITSASPTNGTLIIEGY